MPSTFTANTIGDIQEVVQAQNNLLIRGGGSKTALSTSIAEIATLNLHKLSGILEYDPGEYTFTAYAGTTIADVERALAENNQYLPFAPPFTERGATLGGTIAAGLSGSARQRYGGVRDFLIGIRFIDGQGQLVRGGGKVVKNAAGFDLPKLQVGSLGRLGVLVEASFKVFPRPQTYSTLKASYLSLLDAIDGMQKLAAAPFDIEALDLTPHPDDNGATLWVRLGGLETVIYTRMAQLQSYLGVGETIDGADETHFWRDTREFSWMPSTASLIKIPLTPSRIVTLEQSLAGAEAVRHYAVGGNLGWIAWSRSITELHNTLEKLNLSGLVLLGPSDSQRIGVQKGRALAQRVKQALDPTGSFLEI